MSAMQDPEAVVQAYLPRIRRIAGRVGLRRHPVLEVEDLVQAGVVGLLEALQTYDEGQGTLTTYAGWRILGAMQDTLRAMAVVKRRALRLTRLPADPVVQRQYGQHLQQHAQQQGDPAAHALARLLQRAVWQAIAALPSRHGLMLHLYYVEEMPMKKIGIRLGLTETGVWWVHKRALDRLRPLLAAWDDGIPKPRRIRRHRPAGVYCRSKEPEHAAAD